MDRLPTTVRRVALAGDWHGDTPYAKRAIDRAREYGAEGIIHLGDFGIWPGGAGSRFRKAVDRTLGQAGLWLALVDGNHEDHWWLNEQPINQHGVRPIGEHMIHLPRGTRWTWTPYTWVALGGAVSLDKKNRRLGMEWWPEEAITASQAEHAVSGGRAHVLLTHDVAAGVDVPGLFTDWDPVALAEAGEARLLLQQVAEQLQPKRWWHGHMHVNYYRTVEFAGTPCLVHGLDCNGAPIASNVVVVDTELLAEVA